LKATDLYTGLFASFALAAGKILLDFCVDLVADLDLILPKISLHTRRGPGMLFLLHPFATSKTVS